MTWLGAAGGALVAFGPLTALAIFVVARRSHLSIIAVVAAFAWMLSNVLAAVVWVAIPPLKSEWFWVLPSGVAVQELCRWLFFRGYARVERAIKRALDASAADEDMGERDEVLTDLSSSLSAGTGYGLMQAVIVYGSVLENGFGDGTYFTAQCPWSLFTMMSLTTCCVSISQVAWMILAFDGYRRRSWPRVAGLVALHLGSSMATLMNQQYTLCQLGLMLQFFLTLLSVLAACMSRRQLAARDR